MLLIACGNAAALMLVRGLQRQPEYAVRNALGVGRLALFRQVATESLLLAVGGGVLGVGLAFAIVRLFKASPATPSRGSMRLSTGWPVLAFGLGAARSRRRCWRDWCLPCARPVSILLTHSRAPARRRVPDGWSAGCCAA